MNDTHLDAIWCKDSETSDEYLLDLKTGLKLLVRHTDGSIGEYHEAQ